MVAEDFILAKRKSWERLTDLIKGAQSNIVALNAADLQELGRLYRQTTSDLAQARRDYPGHQLTVYLNDLVAQGHSAIYREQISSSTAKIKHYFAVLLPQTFRQTLPFTLIAFLVFLIPALVGAVIAAGNPDAGVALQPELQPTIENMRIGHEWWQDINDGNSGSAAFILTNNISVSFKAFIGGLSLGLFTLYILYYNGLMLGIVSGAAHNLNFSSNLWGFVAAHGVVELSIIFISGGAGLQLAWAILNPGLLTRRAALVAAARRTFILAGAIVIFLIAAGLIEGFISPSSLPFWVKLSVSIGSGLAFYSYLFLAGRTAPVEDDGQLLSIIRIEQA